MAEGWEVEVAAVAKAAAKEGGEGEAVWEEGNRTAQNPPTSRNLNSKDRMVACRFGASRRIPLKSNPHNCKCSC